MTELRNAPIVRVATVVLAVVVLLLVSAVAVSAVYAGRIVAGTNIGSIPVGTLTRQEAAARIQERLDELSRNGVSVLVGDRYEVVLADSLGLDLNIQEALDLAYERGHRGSWLLQGKERFSALWLKEQIPAPVFYDETLLDDRVDDIGLLSDVVRKDVRLSISGTRVEVLTDTRPGKVVDREHARVLLVEHLNDLDSGPFSVRLLDDLPRATAESAAAAKQQAERMIARPVVLEHEDLQFSVPRDMLGSWIVSEYEYDRLVAGIDRGAVAQYVTRIAEQLNIAAEPAGIETQDGLIVGFTPPKYGRAVQEDDTAGLITELLLARRESRAGGDIIAVPMRQTSPPAVALDEDSGIRELIGRATTPFTGSPTNRVSNIKNGSRFLSGVVIEPDEEFSTLGTLGTIDNTTGYLPELVIKGDRTVPEFGGGLCQVSTTLFRAVLDAGLPVTARRNHSFRVGYYEKDEHGRFIGPGLDATIYEPDLDLKFRNDTGNAVLVISYVHDTKITFELYGTKDGRSSEIIGPTTLTEVPAGDPVYIETDELPPGQVKQVEWAHPGGSAVATYIVTYADGHAEEQEFRSWYRRWPDKFLVGRDPLAAAATGEASATPVPSPTPME